MRLSAILATVSALLVLALAAPAPAAGPRAGAMRDDGVHMEPWMQGERHDILKAAATAKANGKTLLVVIEGPGCTACAAMHREHFADPAYAAFLTKHFDVHLMSTAGTRPVVAANGMTLSERDFAAAAQVRGTPTLMFINAKGEEYFRIPGLPEALYFRAFIDYVADGSAEKGDNLEAWWSANEAKLRARHGA